jgi:hypothetical protein
VICMSVWRAAATRQVSGSVDPLSSALQQGALVKRLTTCAQEVLENGGTHWAERLGARARFPRKREQRDAEREIDHAERHPFRCEHGGQGIVHEPGWSHREV